VVSENRRGFWYGFAAFFTWGLFPLYWIALEPAGATEVLGHRIVWSVLTMAVLVAVLRLWPRIRLIVADRRRLLLITIGSVLIAVNWAVFIWGVTNGHVVETSLGYFINPLVLIFLGVAIMGERLRLVQWIAIVIATVAVVQLTFDYGRPPWVALALAFSFGTYGLMKKKADVGAVEGLAIETMILAPVALGYLVFLHADGSGTFGREGLLHALLIAGSGIVTAIPLLLFGGAATRVPMTTLGLLQYVAPIMQFVLGLVVFGEQMTPARWVGFGLVWCALTIITAESLVTRRRAVPMAVDVPVRV
jgi:chloramphenicol-sensitive protein RarD